MKKNLKNKKEYFKPDLKNLGTLVKTTLAPKGASTFETNGHAAHLPK